MQDIHIGRTLIILPALNEEASIRGVLEGIRTAVPAADILVVDDGSTDATATIARAAGARVVSLPYNMGVGAALRTGFRFASREGYHDVIQCDADGQHPAEQIPLLQAALESGADLAIGSRFADGAGEYEVERTRGLAMRIIRLLLRALTGQQFSDPTSGFRAFSESMVDEFARTYPREFLSDTVEALLLATYSGFRVVEVPVSMRHRASGQPSHRNLRLMYQYLHLLMVIALTVSLRGRAHRTRRERS